MDLNVESQPNKIVNVKFAFVIIFVTTLETIEALETIGGSIFISNVMCVRMKKGETNNDKNN